MVWTPPYARVPLVPLQDVRARLAAARRKERPGAHGHGLCCQPSAAESMAGLPDLTSTVGAVADEITAHPVLGMGADTQTDSRGQRSRLFRA
jgi:hypothetical protein